MPTDKPWIDIGTLAIARKLVKQGMESFLSCMTDRDEFRLRWIFHLDTYPFPGLEQYFDETLHQAIEVSHLFDDAVIIASRSHQGFGGSFLHVIREAKSDLFSIEADFHWHRPFSLQSILDRKQDYVSFKGTPIGSISPSYWSPCLVAYLRNHYPSPPQHATARDFMRILGPEFGPIFSWRQYTMDQRQALRDLHFTHVGDEATKALGVKKYGPLRYYYDSDKGKLVKVGK